MNAIERWQALTPVQREQSIAALYNQINACDIAFDRYSGRGLTLVIADCERERAAAFVAIDVLRDVAIPGAVVMVPSAPEDPNLPEVEPIL